MSKPSYTTAVKSIEAEVYAAVGESGGLYVYKLSDKNTTSHDVSADFIESVENLRLARTNAVSNVAIAKAITAGKQIALSNTQVLCFNEFCVQYTGIPLCCCQSHFGRVGLERNGTMLLANRYNPLGDVHDPEKVDMSFYDYSDVNHSWSFPRIDPPTQTDLTYFVLTPK